MYTNPEVFTNHIFAALLRINPALPLRAKTREAAKAKMLSAAMLLRLLTEERDYRRTLALESMDSCSQYAMPRPPAGALSNVKIGSGRKYARDRRNITR